MEQMTEWKKCEFGFGIIFFLALMRIYGLVTIQADEQIQPSDYPKTTKTIDVHAHKTI